MPSTRKKAGGFSLPAIVAGGWIGELAGTPSVHFGQSVQPGPPRQSVEFSYLIVGAALLPPDKKFRWPGVVMFWAPTPLKSDSSDAGLMFRAEPDPFSFLHLSLEVTRPQFSDVLRLFESRRVNEFYFTIEDEVEGSWPIRSWGMTSAIGS